MVFFCLLQEPLKDFEIFLGINVITAYFILQTIDASGGSGGRRLYVCGTNAHAPRDLVVHANLTRLARHEFYPGVGDGVAKCPFDPVCLHYFF